MISPWYIDPLNITIRLLLALILGGLIGIERERSNNAAGFRTHILVCLGSTLVTLLSMYGFSDFVNEENVRMDPARLPAQVISGIGFLGAGVILRNGTSITGLTTAASLWVVATIGLAIGAGFYLAAGLSTVLVIFSLFILNKVEKKWIQPKKVFIIKIKVMDKPGSLGEISMLLQSQNIEIRKVSVEHVSDEQEDQDNHKHSIYMTFAVKFPKANMLIPIIESIQVMKEVSEVTVE